MTSAQSITPQQLDSHMRNAVMLHQQGRLADAEKLYRQALDSFPGNADIMNLLGTLCSQDNRLQEGLQYLQQALRVRPGHPHYMLNLGQTLVQLGRTTEAITEFEGVLRSQPRSAVAHFNLANCYKKAGQTDSACRHYQTAVSIDASSEKYLYNYANALQAAGRYRSAIGIYQQLLELNPEHAQAHNNLGIVLSEWDRYREAGEHYRKAISIRPDFVDALHNLLQLYESNGQVNDARETCDRLSSVLDGDVHIAIKRELLLPVVAGSESEMRESLSRLDSVLDEIDAETLQLEKVFRYDLSYPSIAIYYGQDDVTLRKKYANMFAGLIEPLAPIERDCDATPNIAFIVTRGHEGVFLKCMAGLIRMLPGDIDCTIVCSSPNGRTILSEHLPDVTYLEIGADIEQAAREIHAQCFDILFYWEIGTDCHNYFLPFFRPVRIQVACWGWPSTSGIPQVDYYLSSELLETDTSDAHYSEKLLRLSRLPVYYYRPPVPDGVVQRSEFGFEEDDHLYLCAQNLRKVHPGMDRIFSMILQRDDKAHILLIDDKREQITGILRQRLADTCEDMAERIHFMQRMPAERYLALVKTADVILDSFCYTGGANTNYDAFAAGTPVVTLPTGFHRGRYTCAAYNQAGYHDCIATDEEDYVRIAITLANDAGFRAKASESVKAACRELLEDQKAVDEFVENVYFLNRDV